LYFSHLMGKLHKADAEGRFKLNLARTVKDTRVQGGSIMVTATLLFASSRTNNAGVIIYKQLHDAKVEAMQLTLEDVLETSGALQHVQKQLKVDVAAWKEARASSLVSATLLLGHFNVMQCARSLLQLSQQWTRQEDLMQVSLACETEDKAQAGCLSITFTDQLVLTAHLGESFEEEEVLISGCSCACMVALSQILSVLVAGLAATRVTAAAVRYAVDAVNGGKGLSWSAMPATKPGAWRWDAILSYAALCVAREVATQLCSQAAGVLT
jgi:hypothetical protein